MINTNLKVVPKSVVKVVADLKKTTESVDQIRSKPPFPPIPSFLVTAIVMSYWSEEHDVRLLMLTLSKRSRTYLQRHWKLLETWLAPTHMQLVSLKKYHQTRSLYDYKTDKWTTVTTDGFFAPL